jgi:hypothetical protein
MWGLQRHRRLTRKAVVVQTEADISEPGTMPSAPHRCRNGNNDNAKKNPTISVGRLVMS